MIKLPTEGKESGEGNTQRGDEENKALNAGLFTLEVVRVRENLAVKKRP